jgi:hypothetical protein
MRHNMPSPSEFGVDPLFDPSSSYVEERFLLPEDEKLPLSPPPLYSYLSRTDINDCSTKASDTFSSDGDDLEARIIQSYGYQPSKKASSPCRELDSIERRRLRLRFQCLKQALSIADKPIAENSMSSTLIGATELI